MNRQRFINIAAAGTLVIAAVAVCVARAAPAPTPAAKVFAALDINHDQVVSAQEFEAGYADLQRAVAVGIRLRDQFRAVDADQSGAIEAGEYAKLVLVQQAGAAAPPLSAFDANADRKLGFAEYVALVRKLAEPAATPAGR